MNYSIFSSEERARLASATALVVSCRWAEAYSYLAGLLDGASPPSSRPTLFRLEVAGLLLDVGSEGKIKAAVIRSKETLVAERAKAEGLVAPETFEYNLVNAEHALFEVDANRNFALVRLDSVACLTTAKNHYWRALKLIDGPGHPLRIQLMVNLGNVVRGTGQLVEALQWYETALRSEPGFGPAHFNRAETLDRLPCF